MTTAVPPTAAPPAVPHLRDSLTMLRRNLLHARRYPSMTLQVALIPVFLLLLFVFVFGSALGSGTGQGDRTAYLSYLVPGMLLMTAGVGAVPTAVAVCTDMTEGIVARFRTMAISRASILVGHVVGSVIQTMITLVLLVAVAFAIGFRPDASPVEWLAACGLLVLFVLALTWLSVALGLISKTPEGASNAPLPISFLLPFVSSTFVPVDSMPSWIRWFAEYQPFTTVVETVRGLLTGPGIGHNAWMAVAWCVGIAVLGFVWSLRLFDRDTR
ncbi:ABC transporter integral membrane protein [Streptomyces lincolnensis]|uniref:Transport permease protein n=2 Tax=Streptomyces lincolnensis TaxID=1915 RepID=A0A1B1MJF5_STRLN|nr:ABC transporter integral membrane protein [Streptomyces lincolnensis]AXG53065.1 ABC transporter integral membrane protein [Streptomyces lincolnensis]